MDDRTAIRSSGTELVQTCRDWKQWSEATRLQENWANLQLMGRTEAKQNEIRNAGVEQGMQEWQQKVCEVTEVLGASISRSGLPDKKQLQRVEKYKQNLSLLATIPWRNRASYMGAVRVLCNSAVACDRITTTPTNELMDAMAAKIWTGNRIGLRGAAKYLKWLIEGANTHLSALMPCRLLGIMVMLVRREQIAWKPQPSMEVSTLRKMLKHLGWTATAAFCWKHDTAREVDMGTSMEKESQQARAAHQNRESFRVKAWNLFFSTTRRHEITSIEKNTKARRETCETPQNGGREERHPLGNHDRWSHQPAWLRPQQNETADC